MIEKLQQVRDFIEEQGGYIEPHEHIVAILDELIGDAGILSRDFGHAVDSLGEALARAERAEAERDEADRKAKWFEVEGTRLLAEIEGIKSATHLAGLRADARAKERDEALAAKERAEAELSRMCRESMAYKQEREAEKRSPFDKRAADRLADEVAVLVRRGVIGSRSQAADALLDYRDPPSTERADRLAVLEKREAEMVAMIEALTDYLSMIHDQAEEPDGHPDILRMATRALSLTPPAASAQQREYVGALERVAESANVSADARHTSREDGAYLALCEALASLDAVKGGR